MPTDEFDPSGKSLNELDRLRDFFGKRADDAVGAHRGIGGPPGRETHMSELARGQRAKQVAADEELFNRLASIHDERTLHAQELDEHLKAPIAPDPETWANDPSHWDWPGIDTPR